MRTFYEQNKPTIHKILFLVCFILGVYLFLQYLFAYVVPFVLGGLLALALIPATDFFEKKCKIPRGISALFLIIICILLISVLGTSLAARIGREMKSFSDHLPQYADDAMLVLSDWQVKINDLLEYLPNELRGPYDELLSSLFMSLTSLLGSGVRAGSVGLVVRLPNILMTIILTIISAFFFIKDKRLIRKTLTKSCPDWLRRNFLIIRTGLFGALGGYVRAQLIIMSATSVIAILGLAILRSPYAFVMGLLISLIDALPVFGGGFILWPWIVLSLIMGDYSLAIGLGILYGAVFLTRQFLEPKVLGKQIGLHPLLTLMSMYAGVRIFGVLGFMVGPVIVLVVKAVMTAELTEDLVEEIATDTGQ